MKKSTNLNPIAIWHKWKQISNKSVIDPEFWMYNYRIPKVEEFIEGFKYEYLTLMITKPDGTVEVNFQEFIFGSEATGHPIEKIKQMLETGYIRVKVGESNQTTNQMKVFYFDVKLRKLKRKDNTKGASLDNPVIGFDGFAKKQNIKYIISKGANAKEASDNIKACLGIKDGGFAENQGCLILATGDFDSYVVTSGGFEITKDNISDIPAEYSDFYVLQNSMYAFSELWPKNTTIKIPVKNLKGEELFIQGSNDKKYPVYQTVKQEDEEKDKVKRIPLVKSETYQPERSPNRLVWIVNKKTSDVKRISWTEATELNKTNPDYVFTSKQEGKLLKRKYFLNKDGDTVEKCKIGKSFTAAKEDNGIYIERRKFPKSKSSTKVANPKRYKTTTEIIRNKDREDLVKGKYRMDFSEKDGVEVDALGKYTNIITKDIKKESIFIPISSDLIIKKQQVIKKHNKGKFKNPNDIKEFVVTITKHYPEGEASYVYTILAPNAIKAENRAWKRIKELGLDKAYFKAHSEEIVKSEVVIPEKKDNRSNGFLLPKIVKLHTPLIKKDFDEKGKLVPKEIWEITKWIRQFSSIEVIKKVKNWKHPIKDFRK